MYHVPAGDLPNHSMLPGDDGPGNADCQHALHSLGTRPSTVRVIRSRVYSPYQNMPPAPVSTTAKKKYVISTPPPGLKPKAFLGVDYLREMKKAVIERKITIVPTAEESLRNETVLFTNQTKNNKTRYVLRIPKRASSPVVAETSHQIGATAAQWTAAPELVYACPESQCYWKGSTELEFNKHLRERHPLLVAGSSNAPARRSHTSDNRRSSGVRCSECDTPVYSRALLLKHMGTAHGIALPSFTRVFTNDEFEAWKQNVKDAFCVDFVTGSGPKHWSGGARVAYLICSRSGDLKERANKKFCRPPRNTIKCGKTCTAYLKMQRFDGEDENAPMAIEGCLYHTGHTIDPERVTLTGEEMDAVYAVAERFGELCTEAHIHEIRELLGHNAPRFRLIEDETLMRALPRWVDVAMREWKYKIGGRTEADHLADTIVFTAPLQPRGGRQMPPSGGFDQRGQYSRETYTYPLLDDEMGTILTYESDRSGGVSDQEESINVTDDFQL